MILNISRRLAQIFVVVAMAFTPLTSSYAQETVAEMVAKACKPELAKFCGTVSPGRARAGACLFAHNDQLSDECEIAFEVGLVQLSFIFSTVGYVVEQCSTDIDTYCDDVIIGGKRLGMCLNKNIDKLEDTCKAAFNYAKESLQ